MPSRPYAWQQRQEHSRQLLSRGERTLPTAVTKASYLSIIYLPTYLPTYLSIYLVLSFLPSLILALILAVTLAVVSVSVFRQTAAQVPAVI